MHDDPVVIVGAARTPIVAVTANVMKGEEENCFASGMDAYLPKPVNIDRLRTTLERWLPLRGKVETNGSKKHETQDAAIDRSGDLSDQVRCERLADIDTADAVPGAPSGLTETTTISTVASGCPCSAAAQLPVASALPNLGLARENSGSAAPTALKTGRPSWNALREPSTA